MENLKAIGIDVDEALARLRGNQSLYTKLLSKLAAGAELEALRVSMDEGDAELSTRNAHTIKGAAANLSAKSIQQKALELEQSLKTDNAVGGVQKALFAELDELYTKFKAAVTA